MIPYTIRKIVVPVDLSETSFNSLDTAVVIAKKHNAALHVVHVTEPIPDAQDEDRNAYLSAQANTDVLTALAGAIQHAHGLKPELLFREGHVVESIITTALSEQCDLIVMGTHGASGFRDGFIGSNTYNIIKYATCPVLTVPSKRQISSFKKVLFPIRPIAGALMRYDVACHFLSANTILEVLGLSYMKMGGQTGVLDRIVGEIKEQLDADRVKVNTSWGTGESIAEDILQFSHQNNTELIILTSSLDAVSKPNFIGPHTQKLINASKVPVLSIKKLGVPVFA